MEAGAPLGLLNAKQHRPEPCSQAGPCCPCCPAPQSEMQEAVITWGVVAQASTVRRAREAVSEKGLWGWGTGTTRQGSEFRPAEEALAYFCQNAFLCNVSGKNMQ